MMSAAGRSDRRSRCRIGGCTTEPPKPWKCKARLLRPNGTTRAVFPAFDINHAQRRALRILKKAVNQVVTLTCPQ